MNVYTYVVVRDYGFAPNPFHGYCTLATCKPFIRKNAKIGDWIIGTGSASKKINGYLIYAMEVNEKMTFNEYWDDVRFQCKKPAMSSLKKMYGDNIYNHNMASNQWMQLNSHHSLENGIINIDNLRRDTSTDAVLISHNFYYFGKSCVKLPNPLQSSFAYNNIGQKKVTDTKEINKIIKWLQSRFEPGYRGNPYHFSKFERYSGK